MLPAPRLAASSSLPLNMYLMQGFFSLWRGHTATLLHRIPYSAVNFAVFENTKSLLAPFLKSRSEGGSYATEVRPLLLSLVHVCHSEHSHIQCARLNSSLVQR